MVATFSINKVKVKVKGLIPMTRHKFLLLNFITNSDEPLLNSEIRFPSF